LNETLIKQREDMYKFLSQLYLWEVDAARLNKMRSLTAPEPCGVDSWDDGWREMMAFLQSSDEGCLDALAVDYARTFLSAGVAHGQAAFPYESVYTDKSRQPGGVADSALAALYAKKGLKPSESAFKVPNDHIGLELAFMALLCRGSKSEQREFFDAHLLNWCAGFCRDAEKHANTTFYKAVAKITAGFIELESGLMREEGAIWGSN